MFGVSSSAQTLKEGPPWQGGARCGGRFLRKKRAPTPVAGQAQAQAQSYD